MERDDYELGEDVTELARVPREQRGIVVSPRFTADETDAILRAAAVYGVEVVEFVRMAALSLASTSTQDLATNTATFGNVLTITRLSQNT